MWTTKIEVYVRIFNMLAIPTAATATFSSRAPATIPKFYGLGICLHNSGALCSCVEAIRSYKIDSPLNTMPADAMVMPMVNGDLCNAACNACSGLMHWTQQHHGSFFETDAQSQNVKKRTSTTQSYTRPYPPVISHPLTHLVAT